MVIPQRARKWVRKQIERIPAVRQGKAIVRGKRAMALRIRLNKPKVRNQLLGEFGQLYQKHQSPNAETTRAPNRAFTILTKRTKGMDTTTDEQTFDRLMEKLATETADRRVMQFTKENAMLEQNYADIMAKRIAIREIGINHNDKELIEFIARLPAHQLRSKMATIAEKLGRKTKKFVEIYEAAYRELSE